MRLSNSSRVTAIPFLTRHQYYAHAFVTARVDHLHCDPPLLSFLQSRRTRERQTSQTTQSFELLFVDDPTAPRAFASFCHFVLSGEEGLTNAKSAAVVICIEEPRCDAVLVCGIERIANRVVYFAASIRSTAS